MWCVAWWGVLAWPWVISAVKRPGRQSHICGVCVRHWPGPEVTWGVPRGSEQGGAPGAQNWPGGRLT